MKKTMNNDYIDTMETFKYLKLYGKIIGEKAKNGNKLCIDIIKYYKMFYDCQEIGSLVLLEIQEI